ncbi:MAG: hypothetical protein ACRDYX_21625 [Egibacteraceae bacterium]
MERWTHEEFCELYRVMGEPTQEAFAEWLDVGSRSVQRWLTEPDKRPSAAVSHRLDGRLRQAARERLRWVPADQVQQMHRRDLLTLLSTAAATPLGGMSLPWSGGHPRISAASLSSLEEITTVLAGKYSTSPPYTLLGSAMGHLEEVSGLLKTATMGPSERERLESVVADVAIFVGALSMASGKLAQADAHLGLAEKMAKQAGSMALLAQVFAEQALLQYYAQPPAEANDDPRDRVALLEQAQTLAARYAPAIVQMAINGWLAEDMAAVPDARGADEALDRCGRAFQKAQTEGPVGTGFCSSVGRYGGWGEGRLEGFRGTVEVSLRRPGAVRTFETSLRLKSDLRGRANGLADLATALITTHKQPEEPCARIAEAHTVGVSQGSAVIRHHVLRARLLMPPKWNSLRCVRELDERLGTR